MRLSGFGWVHSMNSPLRLCLCLVLVCLMTTGATGSTAGKEPVIKEFTAAPLVLEDGQAALYTFVVKGATEVVVTEEGHIIKDIKNPTSATLEGNAQGMTTYAIRTGDSNTFTAVLIAKNDSGETLKEITLRFATELLPKPASLIPPVSETKARTPLWGPQTSAPATSPSSTPSTTTHNEPEFAECPSGCESCLKPDEAAELGFTKKCLEERCYYSPDNTEQWFCYSEPEGWCCKNTQVSEATKTHCDQVGGDWYANEAQAINACQPMCWCCAGGQVRKVTVHECGLVGGGCYATQYQAQQACQPACWCCARGQVGQVTQAQCLQMGGHCYNTQTEAVHACQPPEATCWCCTEGGRGRVVQTNPAACRESFRGTCYSTEAEAVRACPASEGRIFMPDRH